MRKHLRINVRGVVQGVFFRASTKAKADALGVRGLVQNQPDGSVYIEAEGDPQVLDSFVAWCHRGPAQAVVEACEVFEGQLKGFEDFSIKR